MEEFSAVSIALPAFLIVLREGIEAALIVGIIGGFLKQTGRSKLMPYVLASVLLAVFICSTTGYLMFKKIGTIAQKQQELVVGIVGFIAVVMLTYMIFWLKKASPQLKSKLQANLEANLGSKNETRILIFMAFLAVIREGLEVIFILIGIISQTFGKPSLQSYQNAYITGASLGLLIAVLIGYVIYRTGAKINLQKFFRWTGVFLIFVAAGLFVGSFRALHEAGVWNLFQQQMMLCNKQSLLRVAGTFSILLIGFALLAALVYVYLFPKKQIVFTRRLVLRALVSIFAILVIGIYCYSVRIFPDFETMYANLPQCINMQKVLPEDSSFLGVMLSGFFGYTDSPVLSDFLMYWIYLIPALLVFFYSPDRDNLSKMPKV